jgi:hypothetical protein
MLELQFFMFCCGHINTKGNGFLKIYIHQNSYPLYVVFHFKKFIPPDFIDVNGKRCANGACVISERVKVPIYALNNSLVGGQLH